MKRRRHTTFSVIGSALATIVLLAGCSAGSRTGAADATEVPCDIEQQDKALNVNVLAYNSSAIDPFTNTMVKSCSKGDIKLNHEPTDFNGQVQKTTATLAGDQGTYDIVETYGFVIPQFSADKKLLPLDDLVEKYSDEYGLDQLNAEMKAGMSYDGKLYGLPMQAQMFIFAYRKDIFDKLGLEPPKTFEELRQTADKIKASGEMDYPLALPWLASADIVTAYDSVLGSLGTDLTDPESMTANLDSPASIKALGEMRSLLPYMDPEVTTFDQPAVQQQMYNGSAAMSVMFSGRMVDLTSAENSQFADKFAFAAPPAVEEDGKLFNTLSIDGWSIPANHKADEEALFEMVASSVSEKASKAAVPAAYPARDGMVSEDSSPYAAAANEAITNVPPAEPYPWTSEISLAITPIIANVVLGKTSVENGAETMQDQATKILATYK